MEVSTALSRYSYLSENEEDRRERTQRIRVTQIDFRQNDTPRTHEITDSLALKQTLDDANTDSDLCDARLYMVEDLSRDMIELFGSEFDIDPHFFRSHVNDYMWSTITSNKVEPRELDVVSRKRTHFMLQYLRPRYYRNTPSFVQATVETGKFNVLRQLDSDRSRKYLMDGEGAAVCLMRAKLSLWFRRVSKNHKFPIGSLLTTRSLTVLTKLGILLVDPTPSEGYPLWGGHTSFSNWESKSKSGTISMPPRTSLFNDVVYWMCQISDDDVAEIVKDPTAFAIPALKLMLSDWHHVVQYMTTQVAQIEWQIELPEMRQNLKYLDDTIISKLHPWRRNMSLYRAMVASAIHRLYPGQPSSTTTLHGSSSSPQDSLESLRADFQMILDDIDSIQAHISQLVSVATATQSLDESRQAMEQNKNVTRLTYLATLFIPLSFISGLLSMVPDVTQLQQTFWIYFVIAIPVTVAAFVTADFLHLQKMLSRFLKPKQSQGG